MMRVARSTAMTGRSGNVTEKRVMDFFDASINRVAAWVIGARNAPGAYAGGERL